MLGILKKLFSSKKETIQVVSNNQEIIEKLYQLVHDNLLTDIINKPHNKIFILNVYYTTLDSLLNNLVSKPSEKQITSVNVFSYFKGIDDINYTFKRMIPILENTTVNTNVIHDLNEIFNSIEFLKSIEE